MPPFPRVPSPSLSLPHPLMPAQYVTSGKHTQGYCVRRERILKKCLQTSSFMMQLSQRKGGGGPAIAFVCIKGYQDVE